MKIHWVALLELLLLISCSHIVRAQDQDSRIRELTRELNSANWDAVEPIERQLVQIGTVAAPILLENWGHDWSAHTQPDRATKVLAAMGRPVIPIILDGLRSASVITRRASAETVFILNVDGFLGSEDLDPETKELVDALVLALGNGSDAVSEQYLVALWSLGPKASQATPAVLGILQGPSVKLQYWAAVALKQLGYDPIDVLLEILKSTTPIVSRSSMGTINTLYLSDEHRDRIISSLESVLSEKADPAVAQDAIGLLGWKRAKTAVPLLLGALHWNNIKSRSAAIQALGYIHDESDAVVDSLKKALQEPEEPLRCSAVEALNRFRTKAAVDAIRDFHEANPDADLDNPCHRD